MDKVDNANRLQIKDVVFWQRTLYMLLFVIAYGVAEMIAGLIVVVQFVTILVNRKANETLLRFGNSLSAYVRQILRFVMYNTEEMPFPFSDWPQEPADGDRWRGDTAQIDERAHAVDPAAPPANRPAVDPAAQPASKPDGEV